MKTIKTFTAVCALALCAGAAEARDWDHGHGDYRHYDHHRSHTFVSMNFGYPYRPYYYRPAPVFYSSAPVVYTQPYPAAQPEQYVDNDEYCREYQSTIYIGGRPRPSYGTTCLQPDGSWEIQR
jgi:hypothetical protein